MAIGLRYNKNHTRKPPDMKKPLVIASLDVPDSSDAFGPSPLLHKSSSQQDSHTAVPSESGDAHLFEHDPTAEQLRLKVVTVPSLRNVFTMMQRSSPDEQLTTVLLPSPDFGNSQCLSASGLSSRVQL